MRLRAWVKSKGRGAIWRLAAATGISYPTVHALAHDKQRAKPETARLISAATRGAVSVDELRTLPRRRRKRARRRAAPTAAAAA